MSGAISLLGLLGLMQAGPLVAGSVPEPATTAIQTRIAAGRKQEQTGQFRVALASFESAAQLAHASGQRRLEAKALGLAAATHARLFQYRRAVEAAEQARQIAFGLSDYVTAGRATLDLGTIYSQLGDFGLAETEVERAIDLLRQTKEKYALAGALFVRAQILGQEHGADSRTEKAYQEAASAAVEANNVELQAMVRDDLGILLLLNGKLGPAETALNAAHSLCLKAQDSDLLPVIEEHLAELNLAKKNYPAALTLIDSAFASRSPLFKINPQYYPIHVRAEILLGLGRTDAALSEFRRAVEAADQWREGALPGDTTATQTVVLLDSVYRDFAELAATLAIKRHESTLSREAFEALARNRAASLREQLIANFSRAKHLPDHYFELLADLQAAQARVTLENASGQDREKLRQIRIALDRLENEMGLEAANLLPDPENYSHRNSLRDIQGKLSGAEALLSFCLGKTHSFLWTITGERVNLYELPAAGELENSIRAFSDAIRDGKDPAKPGNFLSTEFFGRLDPKIQHKTEWLITPDSALLDGFPFAALPLAEASAHGARLLTAHTIRLLPSELLLLSQNVAAPSNYFLGVADPIYNLADARRQRRPDHPNGIPSLALARLVGSGREIHTSAALSGSANTRLLTGAEASGESLRKALGRTPEILHFAVHIVSPEGHPEQAALALSLRDDGMPELLTPEIVASYRVPGTLVIMSGCASQQGERLPSAGLIGLARAWLLAGASGVIVSAWPTPDDSGRFFASFYRHFHEDGPASCTLVERAATALAQAQQEMQSTAGYRSSPAFWAAYSLISKE